MHVRKLDRACQNIRRTTAAGSSSASMVCVASLMDDPDLVQVPMIQ